MCRPSPYQLECAVKAQANAEDETSIASDSPGEMDVTYDVSHKTEVHADVAAMESCVDDHRASLDVAK